VALQPGLTILDKYRIVKQIGEGGMARVWLAEEVTFDGRQVAIKEPKAGVDAEDAAELQRRFQQEISLTAALMQARAPNIVPAWTVEPLDGGRVLVMQYMPGGSLEEMLRRPEHAAGLPIERAVAIALDVLGALEALHRLPTEPVHRDVKPSNILFDGEGRACLADFGLAQLPGVSGRSRLAAGAHPATPLYAAPEQLRSPEPLLPAADLFALGCVLWEMLTGQRYKRSKPGTPPSQLRAEVPAWLDQVVMKALAEDAWERWQSAGEMAQALRAGQAAMQQAQQAVEAQRLAEEQARQAAAARRAAEEQARQEAERRAQVEAAERVRQQETERQQQLALATMFAEAKALAEQQPDQALALLAQIRSVDPAHFGLTELERRAHKAQKKAAGGRKPPKAWLGWTAGGVALMAVAAVIFWIWSGGIGSGGDATATLTTMSGPAAVQVIDTPTPAPSGATPSPPAYTPMSPAGTPVLPAEPPASPADAPIPSTYTPTLGTPTATITPTPFLAMVFGPGSGVASIGSQDASCRAGSGCTLFQLHVSSTGNQPVEYQLSKKESIPVGWGVFFCWEGDCEFGNAPPSRILAPGARDTVSINFRVPSVLVDGDQAVVNVNGTCPSCPSPPFQPYSETFTVVVVASTVTATYTATPQPDAVVNTQNANLRAGPGTNYDRLASYASGTALAVTGKTATGDWLQVQAPDGVTGWMADSVLEVNADLEQVAVAAAPPTPFASASVDMVFVPAGDFTMGSPEGQGDSDEHPEHTVYLDAFYIDKTEVTAAQYQRCVEAGACSATSTGSPCTYGAAGKSDHPINCVEWNQAVDFCRWAGKRLPTEAEWEKAARGTDGRVYPWGNEEPDCGRLNYQGSVCGTGITAPVASYPSGASPYGALDMAGNVWEWVADRYDGGYYAQSPRNNPTGPGSDSLRVLRGGSGSDVAFSVRVAQRLAHSQDFRYNLHFGFRCARSP
jgi:formylglycine-generating enzyme required for sulfatase activity